MNVFGFCGTWNCPKNEKSVLLPKKNNFESKKLKFGPAKTGPTAMIGPAKFRPSHYVEKIGPAINGSVKFWLLDQFWAFPQNFFLGTFINKLEEN